MCTGNETDNVLHILKVCVMSAKLFLYQALSVFICKQSILGNSLKHMVYEHKWPDMDTD